MSILETYQRDKKNFFIVVGIFFIILFLIFFSFLEWKHFFAQRNNNEKIDNEVISEKNMENKTELELKIDEMRQKDIEEDGYYKAETRTKILEMINEELNNSEEGQSVGDRQSELQQRVQEINSNINN